MRVWGLTFGLGLVTAFGLAARLEPWFQSWIGNRARSANLLEVALGDGRKLFARHAYVKADIYFHSGVYPSIYDLRPAQAHMHTATATTAGHEAEAEEHSWLGPPRDWLDRFSRHFYPTRHRHLGESHHGHEPGPRPQTGSQDRSVAGEERELLPWLRLSASLDPQQPQTYVVAAFWLRTRLHRVNEAEQFLREGLRANPGHPEILFELGRIAAEHRNDPDRARNLWELAARNWQQRQGAATDSDTLVYAQILAHLAKLEEDQKRYERALEHLQALKQISPNKPAIERWIHTVTQQLHNR